MTRYLFMMLAAGTTGWCAPASAGRPMHTIKHSAAIDRSFRAPLPGDETASDWSPGSQPLSYNGTDPTPIEEAHGSGYYPRCTVRNADGL